MAIIKKKITRTREGQTLYPLPKDFHKLRKLELNGKKLSSKYYRLKPIAIKYELVLIEDPNDKDLVIEYI